MLCGGKDGLVDGGRRMKLRLTDVFFGTVMSTQYCKLLLTLLAYVQLCWQWEIGFSDMLNVRSYHI